MLILSSTTDKLQLALGAAHSTGDLRIVCSWRDVTTTAYTPGRTVEISDGTTPVDIVTSPAASTQRVVDHINIYNADSINHTVTVTFLDNATSYVLWSGTLLAGALLTYVDGAGWSTTSGTLGYTLNVGCVNTATWTDAATVYIGGRWGNATTSAGTVKVRVPKAGTIKATYLHMVSTTAGSNEAWPAYVRVNDTTDYLIDTVSVSATQREWNNASMSASVAAGDFVEVKFVNPTWATNPVNVTIGGHIYIE